VAQGHARLVSLAQQPAGAAVEEGLTVHWEREVARGAFIEKALPAAAVVIGLLLLAGPFLSTLLRSFIVAPEAGSPAFGLSNFLDLIKDRAFFDAATNTIISGAGATLFSGILGFSLAWIVARTDLPGRGWFEVLNLVPFFCRRMSAP
jgi:iron(III) transport system permease protein